MGRHLFKIVLTWVVPLCCSSLLTNTDVAHCYYWVLWSCLYLCFVLHAFLNFGLELTEKSIRPRRGYFLRVAACTSSVLRLPGVQSHGFIQVKSSLWMSRRRHCPCRWRINGLRIL